VTADFARVFRDANTAGLPFVVVGGIAVVRHGVVRATRDIDLIVEPTESATAALRELISSWGATFATGASINLERVVAGRLVPLRTPFAYVDVLPELPAPLSYAELAVRAEVKRVDGEPVPICSLADLVALKRIAGRPRDEQDLADLEVVHGTLPPPPS